MELQVAQCLREEICGLLRFFSSELDIHVTKRDGEEDPGGARQVEFEVPSKDSQTIFRELFSLKDSYPSFGLKCEETSDCDVSLIIIDIPSILDNMIDAGNSDSVSSVTSVTLIYQGEKFAGRSFEENGNTHLYFFSGEDMSTSVTDIVTDIALRLPRLKSCFLVRSDLLPDCLRTSKDEDPDGTQTFLVGLSMGSRELAEFRKQHM